MGPSIAARVASLVASSCQTCVHDILSQPLLESGDLLSELFDGVSKEHVCLSEIGDVAGELLQNCLLVGYDVGQIIKIDVEAVDCGLRWVRVVERDPVCSGGFTLACGGFGTPKIFTPVFTHQDLALARDVGLAVVGLPCRPRLL